MLGENLVRFQMCIIRYQFHFQCVQLGCEVYCNVGPTWKGDETHEADMQNTCCTGPTSSYLHP